MKANSTLILNLMLLGLISAPSFLHAADPSAPKGKAPELIVVRVKAASDGSVFDVEFLNSSQGNIVRTPTGLAQLRRAALSKKPPTPVDWEQVVVDGLLKLRDDQGLGAESEVRVSVDDDLHFGAALAAVECCRRAGFSRIDFSPGDPSRVTIAVGQDGNLSIGGLAVTMSDIKPHLRDKAKAAGSLERVEIVIRAHPLGKSAPVLRLLQDIRDEGFLNIDVTSQDQGVSR